MNSSIVYNYTLQLTQTALLTKHLFIQKNTKIHDSNLSNLSKQWLVWSWDLITIVLHPVTCLSNEVVLSSPERKISLLEWQANPLYTPVYLHGNRAFHVQSDARGRGLIRSNQSTTGTAKRLSPSWQVESQRDRCVRDTRHPPPGCNSSQRWQWLKQVYGIWEVKVHTNNAYWHGSPTWLTHLANLCSPGKLMS